MDHGVRFREDYEAMTPEELRDQLERLDAAILNHPAYAARSRWDGVRRAHMVWVRNMQELLVLLLSGETDDKLKLELVQNVRPDHTRRLFFEMLDQRLFNLIASSIALVERTNGFRKDYVGKPFLTEFESRNRAIAEAPGTKFLRKLRNYLEHAGVAPFATKAQTQASTGGQLTVSILLDSPTLLKRRDAWDAPSRSFIEDHPEGIHLRSVVEEYKRKMEGLFGWTFLQYESLHTADVDGINDLVRRANLTLTAGATDGKDWEARMEHIASNLAAGREGRPQTDFRTGEPLTNDEGAEKIV